MVDAVGAQADAFVAQAPAPEGDYAFIPTSGPVRLAPVGQLGASVGFTIYSLPREPQARIEYLQMIADDVLRPATRG